MIFKLDIIEPHGFPWVDLFLNSFLSILKALKLWWSAHADKENAF